MELRLRREAAEPGPVYDIVLNEYEPEDDVPNDKIPSELLDGCPRLLTHLEDAADETVRTPCIIQDVDLYDAARLEVERPTLLRALDPGLRVSIRLRGRHGRWFHKCL